MESSQTQTEMMPRVEPQKEHHWLDRLVGDWTMDAEADMGPDRPKERVAGTETVRSLGGLWVVAESESEMPGNGTGTAIMTLGWDPVSRRYVGTWIGSMMAHLWVYNGEVDAAGRVLTLSAEGPSLSGDGKFTQYRDVIEFLSNDQRVLKSHAQRDDGTWQHFMTATYTRRK